MMTAHEEYLYESKAREWYNYHSSWSMPHWSFIPGEQLSYQNKMLGVYL